MSNICTAVHHIRALGYRGDFKGPLLYISFYCRNSSLGARQTCLVSYFPGICSVWSSPDPREPPSFQRPQVDPRPPQFQRPQPYRGRRSVPEVEPITRGSGVLDDGRDGHLPPKHTLTRPAAPTGPQISPVPPPGGEPVQTLPERLPESRTSHLPPKHTLTRPNPRPQVSPVLPVHTLPEDLPEGRTAQAPRRQTRPFARPNPNRPQISPVPPIGNVPFQTLPARLP